MSTPLRIGIGGPVGSGKTALLDRLCKWVRGDYDIAAITNDIYTREDAELLTVSGAVSRDRSVGVEQGGGREDRFLLLDQPFDDPGRLNTELERLRAVTTGDVTAFVDRFLGTDNRAILTYVPEAAKKTPTPSVR